MTAEVFARLARLLERMRNGERMYRNVLAAELRAIAKLVEQSQ